MSVENYKHIMELAVNDVKILEIKGQSYGSSWRNRGGVGAFMMLARKWDRIENLCGTKGYDIFRAVNNDIDQYVKDGVLDDIQDLRRYLLLVESHLTAPKTGAGGKSMQDYPDSLGGMGYAEPNGKGKASVEPKLPGKAYDGHD